MKLSEGISRRFTGFRQAFDGDHLGLPVDRQLARVEDVAAYDGDPVVLVSGQREGPDWCRDG